MSDPFHFHPSSYRDPSGFVFEKNDLLYRQVNILFQKNFEHFINSGCYDHLVKKGLLIPHEELKENLTGTHDWYTTLKPEKIGFLSWPYEWSFDMLKDAAVLTLRLAKEVIPFGMILKDATPYNIQWHKGKMIFIDTLSFEIYNEQDPWIAYRQFCENFLSPLLLMHYAKRSLHEMLLAYPEGIPLSIASTLLPKRSKFSLHTFLHVHLHAKISSGKNVQQKKVNFSKQKLLNLINSLDGLIVKLRSPETKTLWTEYYQEASQREDYLEQKKKIIEKFLGSLQNISTAIDLGANEGEFSKLVASKNIFTISTDADAYCVNHLYREIKKDHLENIQPLVIDLAHPSPATGVNNQERDSFISRTHTDLALALALIHHLCIGKNIPFKKVSVFFAALCKNLIIEFVPKNDRKVQEMLSQKKDIYTNYTEANFITAFENNFRILSREKIPGDERILFLMKKI